jgi:hypothetical protein
MMACAVVTSTFLPDPLIQALASHLDRTAGAAHLAAAIRRGDEVALDVHVGAEEGAVTLVVGRLLPRAGLVVSHDRAWFIAPSGRMVRLHARPVLHRIFRLLVDRRCSPTPTPIAREELVAAVWEGERMRPESGPNRLHFSLSVLRDLGLRDVLLRLPEGYMLDPAVPLLESDDGDQASCAPSAAE